MSTQTKPYKQLTQGQRYQTEALLGPDFMQKEIADKIGMSGSVLSRELNRSASRDGYCAEIAHVLATQRRVTVAKFSKLNEQHMPIIKKGLSLGYGEQPLSICAHLAKVLR